MRSFALFTALCLITIQFSPARAESEIAQSESNNPVIPQAAPSNAFKIPVFYASDRQASPREFPSFKPKGPFALEMGQAPALVVLTDPITNPKVPTDLGWEPVNGNQSITPPHIYVRGYECPDPGYVDKAEAKDESTFLNLIKTQAHCCGDVVYLYVHGYATQFDDAIYTCGVLESIVCAPVICFTWPSVGSVSMTHAEMRGEMEHREDFSLSHAANASHGYMIDEAMIAGNGSSNTEHLSRSQLDSNQKKSDQVTSDLAYTIDDLLKNLDSSTKLCVIAHSLGNRLLVKALEKVQSKRQIDRVVYASADVPVDMFNKKWDMLKGHSGQTLILFNPKDKALGGAPFDVPIWCQSKKCNKLREERLGKYGAIAAADSSVTLVQYAPVSVPAGTPTMIRHYMPFHDLNCLLKSLPADFTDSGRSFTTSATYSILPTHQ